VATQFQLAKPNYKVGEDVIGQFEFGKATLPCYQVRTRTSWVVCNANVATSIFVWHLYVAASIFVWHA
jgi:hypothetical protein